MPERQTVLVTGASRGIGRAIAERFVAEGARVVAVARDRSRLTELAAGHEHDVLPLVADVTDPEAMRGVDDLDALVARADQIARDAERVLQLKGFSL